MPRTKGLEPNEEDGIPSPRGGATIQDKIAAFVMLDGMTAKTQAEKSLRLKLVGFSNTEIAAMLQTTPAVVASNLYQEKKKVVKKSGRSAAAAGDATTK